MDTKTGAYTQSDVRNMKSCGMAGPVFEWVWDHEEQRDVRVLKSQGLAANAPHGMNKNEGRAMRRICSRTGLTPDQVREHKTYRQELAKAAGPRFRTHDKYKNEVKKDPAY